MLKTVVLLHVDIIMLHVNIIMLHVNVNCVGLVCLGVSSYSRIFHSFGDVNITGEKAVNFGLCSALKTIER